MDDQAINTKSDLERILLDERMKAKPLPLSLLAYITHNFSDEHQIGRGGFAVVYKGLLEYGEVAVKKLTEAFIDENLFIGEVYCLMKAKHKNIVRFLGYCSDTQGQMVKYNGKSVMADVRQKLLCFEYVPNGSLDEYIKDESREWEKCYKIIKGVCEGLHYLHKERIVHRDLKPANILLDNDTVPKITDFGISRCFGELQNYATSNLMGSIGYLAPELFLNGKITFEADIYSLGVIITEMLTGDKGCPYVEKIQEHWRHKLEGSLKELQLEQIRVCTEVAQSCLQYDLEKRPCAQTIIDILEQNEREGWRIKPVGSSHNPTIFPMPLDENMKAEPLPFSLLKCITNNFSHEIGHGGFAVVYKGQLEHKDVAVKKLSQNVLDEKKFIAEIQCLMKAKHKNIVRFIGYCSDEQGETVEYDGKFVMAHVCQRLLCFEYVPNGSLGKYIKDPSREWGKCYKIIKGVCEGLHYLHKRLIVHLDLTPANILLDNDMVPKITDFGISRCFDELQTHVVTSNFAGTIGYLAPEFICNGKITLKSDIYSLGTIITEILTGHKGCPEFEEVKKHWSHKLEGSQKEILLEQIRVCTEVAQRCLEFNPVDRLSTQEIIDSLKQTEGEEPSEPGASSDDGCSSAAAASASTSLRSTVAARNMSKKQQLRPLYQNHSRAQPGRLYPETLARTTEMLMQAISKFYARDMKDIIFEELYRGVYNLLLHKKGEELYSAVETTMASEVQSLCRPLDDDAAPVDSTLFLQELLTKWDMHISALQMIGYVFTYMEKTFVAYNRKTPIKELGLRLWRDEMARSNKIRRSLIEVVKRQKGGEDELVPGVNKMLTELGADVKDMPCLCFQGSKGLHVAGP